MKLDFESPHVYFLTWVTELKKAPNGAKENSILEQKCQKKKMAKSAKHNKHKRPAVQITLYFNIFITD